MPRSFLSQLDLRNIILINYGIVILAAWTGWVSASHSGAQISFSEMHRPLTGSVWHDFLHIAKWNVTLATGMVVGICTLGTFTLLELVWNGIHHGFDLYLLSHGCGPAFLIFMRYAPLELASLTLIASAAQELSLSIVRSFLFGEVARSTRSVLLALALGFLMLITAAAIEADMKPTLQTIGCR